MATGCNLSNSSVLHKAAKRQDASAVQCCKGVEKSMHLVLNIVYSIHYNHSFSLILTSAHLEIALNSLRVALLSSSRVLT
jgi:hypothetical protein